MKELVEILRAFYNSVWFKLIVGALILLVVWFFVRAAYRRVCRGLIGTVEYRREFSSDGVYEGDTVILTETLHNKRFFPIFVIDVWGYIYNDLRVVGAEYDDKKAMQPFAGRFVMLMPFMQLRRRHEIVCKKRGYYKLEGVDMMISQSHRYVESEAELYVFPAPLDPPEKAITNNVLQGDSYSRNWLMRDPFNVSGVRDYVFGDPFNSINFKATAKSGGMRGIKVNNCDFVSSRTVMIYMNFQPDPDAPVPTRIYNGIIERFLGFAAGILRDAAASGYRCGLAANCVNSDNTNRLRFPIYSGEAHHREMMRALALVRPAYGVSFPGIVEADVAAGMTGTEIYVFALYGDPQSDSRLRALERMGNTVKTFIFGGEEDPDGRPE